MGCLQSFPIALAEELQELARERFVAAAGDAEKLGLPRVLDSVQVSCRTGRNLRQLRDMLYDTAFSLRLPGKRIIVILVEGYKLFTFICM